MSKIYNTLVSVVAKIITSNNLALGISKVDYEPDAMATIKTTTAILTNSELQTLLNIAKKFTSESVRVEVNVGIRDIYFNINVLVYDDTGG